MEVAISAAKATLAELARRAEAGEEVVLTRHGRPSIRLIPVAAATDPEKMRERRLAAIDRAIAAARNRAPDGGASAARSQDFLYDDHGLPA